MMTIAAASVIKGVVLLAWGSETRRIESFFGTEVIHLFGATITSQVLCVFGLLLIVTIGLSLFLNRTLFGKALRASAVNPTGASLMGIDINRFRLFCFGLAGGLGAITGIVITPITFTGYEVGILTGLKGLVAAIVGGWTMIGTVVAAVVLGLLEGSWCRLHLGRTEGRFCTSGHGPIPDRPYDELHLRGREGLPMNDAPKQKLLWLVPIAIIIAIPFVAGSYVVEVMCFIAIFGALAVGMGVLLEQAGMFSLAHPSWFGLGGYVSAILAIRGIAPPWLGSIVGAVFVGFLSYAIGAPLVRLKGYYLACATFGLLLIVEISLGQLGSVTGGHEGLMGIPPLSIGGFVLETDVHYYYLSWALCLACFWFLYNPMGSRMGRAIKSFNDSEVAARSMGINVPRYKLRVFMLTAVMASLMGSVYTFHLRFAQPGIFGFPLVVELSPWSSSVEVRRSTAPCSEPSSSCGSGS